MTGHGLRALIINTLKVNGVNAMEVAQAAQHKSLNSQNSYNRPTDAATESNTQSALRPAAAGRKRAPEQDTMTPRKPKAASLMPSPVKPSSSTEKLRLEVESLKMKLQLAQQSSIPPVAQQSYYQTFHPMGPPPPQMYSHPYAGGWGMMPPPPPVYGGYHPQHQVSFYPPHGQQPPMPVQSAIPYQTQPPAPMMPAHTGRPTQQFHFDLQHEVVQYHGTDNHPQHYGEYYHRHG
jgi:hypothetical protein